MLSMNSFFLEFSSSNVACVVLCVTEFYPKDVPKATQQMLHGLMCQQGTIPKL